MKTEQAKLYLNSLYGRAAKGTLPSRIPILEDMIEATYCDKHNILVSHHKDFIIKKENRK